MDTDRRHISKGADGELFSVNLSAPIIVSVELSLLRMLNVDIKRPTVG